MRMGGEHVAVSRCAHACASDEQRKEEAGAGLRRDAERSERRVKHGAARGEYKVAVREHRQPNAHRGPVHQRH